MKILKILLLSFIFTISINGYAKVGDTYDCSVNNHIRHYYSSYTKQGSGPEDRYKFDFKAGFLIGRIEVSLI